ncbi:hypothetical protein [Corynebacterium hadale]|uniref:hypothetical protein n=1 Tax=Corynebacterium hadale TaxID=2026255 RepID=UPI000BAA4756|nr:hypothetical protein [Corynebacterium hadale]PAT12474.1 hypothetical protein CKJ83_06890 [Corynebacterium hadale]
MKRTIAAGLATVTALSLAAVPAQAAEDSNEFIEGVREAVEGPKRVVEDTLQGAEEGARQGMEKRKLDKKLEDEGYGAAPKTDGAKDMIVGSVEQGSSADQAYQATQAGWILTWVAVAAAGLGAIGFVANQAGLLPNMPF